MKCIIIGPAFPLRGGIANFNEALCLAFNEKGIDCSIISFSLQYPGFLFPGKSQQEEGNAPNDFNIYPLINSINPFSWFKTASFIKKRNPDFIIIRYWLPFMAPALGTIARLVKKKIKIIAVTDNVIPHEKRRGDNLLTKYFVKSCHAFVAMSKSVLDDLSLFTNNQNKYYSPHPVYDIFGKKIDKTIARQHLGLEITGRYLLFFGFIRKYKGLDLLLEAMGIQELKDEKVKLIIAGEFYEDEHEYINIIRKYGLDSHVIMRTTFIPRDEVKYYFSAVDMVVQPYRAATQSGVTQIAYHFDCPMLVTNVGGLAEIVKDKVVGYVTDVHPELIAMAIIDFYKHKRGETFTNNIVSEKNNFSWNAFLNIVVKAQNNINL